MSLQPAFHDPATAAGRAHLLRALEDGRVAALPTDTVPGIGTLAGPAEAVERLAALKGSAPDKPFSLHLRSTEDLRRLLPALPPGLPAWLDRRLPGPLTVVLPRAWTGLPADWHWPWPAVGLRLPDHPGYLDFAAQLPGPLLMSSVNHHGEPPLHGAALAAWLGEHPEVACGVEAEEITDRAASAVVSFQPLPRLLRGELDASQLRPGLRVLVLCTGNICRSPLAAKLLESELAAAWGVPPADLQELGWTVASAGSFAMPGGPASEHSVAAAAEIGLELGDHRSRNLAELAALPWDLVLGMSASHLAALPPALAVRAELFDPTGDEVPDPYGGPLSAYRHMREQLRPAVEERIRAWSGWG